MKVSKTGKALYNSYFSVAMISQTFPYFIFESISLYFASCSLSCYLCGSVTSINMMMMMMIEQQLNPGIHLQFKKYLHKEDS